MNSVGTTAATAGHTPRMAVPGPCVRAVSDLHVGSAGNREMLAEIHAADPGDWLIVAGDVAERERDILHTLEILAGRFEKVVWVPGNHELWIGHEDGDITSPTKYQRLVAGCRELGVATPDDDYPLWCGPGGPVRLVPMFLLYDYSWTAVPDHDRAAALARAKRNRVVASDEFLIEPGPFADLSAWCHERLVTTTTRLAELDPSESTILINHWPLLREPTRLLHHQDFALWCGTDQTADWHLRYRATACVYGHLHIPRSSQQDGVRFEEVSLGYPREWAARGRPHPLARPIHPVSDDSTVRWIRNEVGGPAHIAEPGETGIDIEADMRARIAERTRQSP